MTRNEVFEKLDMIFQDIFDDEDIHVTETTTAEDIEDWDSLEHINLIVAIENTFSFKIPMEKIGSMKDVGEMADIIMESVN